MSRLAQARTRIKTAPALDEYQARMAGHLDAALTLLGIVGEDALENLKRNPDDEGTKRVVMQLAAATQALEPLVRLLCPLTACQQIVPAPLTEQEPAGHG